MGSASGRSHRAWLLKAAFVLATFASGLAMAGVVSGAGPLGTLGTLGTLAGLTDTEATTTSPESTETTSESTDTETAPTDPSETDTTQPDTTDTTPTESAPAWSEATEPYLVKFAAGTSLEAQGGILAAAGAEDLSHVRALRVHGVLLPGGDSLAASIAFLESNPAVTRVESDRERETAATPSDSGYAHQWALRKIGWENVFGTVSPDGTARVAILDTGIDGSHPDLDTNVVPGTSILDGSDGLSDPNGHGTAMAGIVAAETDNGAGVAGVGYAGVQLMPVTVLGADGTGQDSDIIEGVVYAAENGADVILMGFSNPGYSELLQEALDYAWDEGAVLVAATGNDGSSGVTFPAGDRGVIGVSNTDRDDGLASSSNHGEAVFLGAPGTDVLTTSAGGGTTSIGGTSASAAFVAGAAALMKAASGATNGVIVSRLARNAEAAGTRDLTGNGRLSLDRAIADSSMGSIQPAGADPVGDGGPIVGPYVAAANNFNVVPASQSVAAGSSNNFSWTFTATNSGNTAITDFTIPSGWPAPQSSTSGAAGYVTVVAGTCPASLHSITGMTVRIAQRTPPTASSGTCANETTITVTYGNVTAPTPASPPQLYTFVNQHGNDPTVTVIVPANTAPTVAFTAPPATASEGETETFDFTITDPDAGDTFAFATGFPTCGSGAALVGSPSIDSTTKTGSFQCLFADGPATPNVQVRVEDAANAESNTASQSVAVANVAPSIAISGAATVDEGSAYTLTLGATADPGSDTISSYVVHWGDGSNDTYATAGAKTHAYADGPASRSITVDLVDEDGTHSDRANDLTVQVDDVAPTIAIAGAASVNEGSSYSLTLEAVTDPGADTITSYVVHWSDGSTDTYATAGEKTHTYADGPSSHSVTVDLVDEDGTHPNRANVHSISVVNVPPTVTAAAAQTADEGTSETFDLGSFTDPGDDDPWQVTVDWGDGSSDTILVASAPGDIADQAHTYADDGTFTVTVTVAEDGGGGASGSATFTVTVENAAPEVTAAADQTASEGTSTLLALGSFTDPGDDAPWRVTVDWGDGSTDTVFDEAAPGAIAAQSHTYADDGSYTVTVTVAEETGTGESDEATFQVTVANVAPAVTAPADQTASEGSSASFSLGSFSDPGDDDPWEVTVDWGDGSTDTVFDEAAPGAIAAQSHAYPDNGAFTVTVSVREDDGTGASGSAIFEVTVANVAPEVTAPADQAANEATPTTFTLGSFTDPGDDDPWEISVDWGDGSSADSFDQSSVVTIGGAAHTYPDNGVFTVTVTVTEDDGAGAAGSATFQVTVANLDPEIANVAADSPVDEGGSSTVTVTATDPAGANDPLSYEFDCDDDGTYEISPQAANSHSCSFGDDGSFDVNVRVTDGDGGSDVASTTVVVQNVDPSITNVTTDSPIDEGDSSTISVSATDPAGANDPLSYGFDCDGDSDFEVGPQAASLHACAFDDDGSFTVNVRVSDDDGGEATSSVQVQVDNVPPTIEISGAASVDEGSSYSLTLGDVTDPGDDTVTQYFVHWGDGTSTLYTSRGVKTHTYADGPATHTITVDLTDEDGTFADRANALSVHVDNVAPTIAVSGAAGVNEGSAYTLTLGAVTDPGTDTVSSYVVHWGDGSSTTYATNGAVTHTYADGPNTYVITVDLVDEDGTYLDVASNQSVDVTNVPPSIAISGAASVNEGATYTLTLGSVTDPGADTVTDYVVHWGDGSSDTYAGNGVKTHTYADGPAMHAISVDLTDEDGTFLDRANELSVQVDNVVPGVTAAANQTADEGTSASFPLGSFSDPGDDDPWEVTVDWGDGSSDTTFDEAAPGTIAAQTHTYADNGVFTVTVSVREDDGIGASGSATFQVTVANVPPSVTPPADQASDEGSPASFSLGSFSDPGDDDPWEVTVDWGDATSDTTFDEALAGAIAANSHTYADNGTYTVTVTVKEDGGAGASGSATFQVAVANVPPSMTPPADQAANEGTSKTFDLGSFTDPGDDDPWEVTVDWGDGSTDTVFDAATAGAIADKAHTYADNDVYTVTVSVVEDDGAGAAGSATFQVTVANLQPSVTKPTFGPTLIGCQTAATLSEISFNDLGTGDSPWTVSVDWGDGSADTTYTTNTQGAQQNQSHVYATAGTFTATVSVTDKDLGTGSNTSTNTTTVFPYTVAFRPPVDGSNASTTTVNKMKNGRVVPIKVQIRDLCAGADLTSPFSVVTIKVTKSSGVSGAGDPVEEYADAGNSSGGTNEFRWSGEHWIYNLDSKALGLVLNNVYRVDVYVNGLKATVTSWAVLQPVK